MSSTMQTKSKNADDSIVQRLRALAKESPELKESAQLYEAILPLLRDADLHVGTVSLTPDQVREKMVNGQPLLSGLDLDLDVGAVRELMIKLAAAMEYRKKHQPASCFTVDSNIGCTDSARRIRVFLKNKLDVGALLPHIAAGRQYVPLANGQVIPAFS
jgi:hypothetical protein